MNAAALQLLLDYHYWARDRMLEALAPLAADEYCRDRGSSFRSLRDTAVHLYSAEWTWFSRWIGRSPAAPLSPEDVPDVATLASAWRSLEGDVRAFVAGLGDDDLARVYDYRLFSGQAGRSVFWHMVQHVVNHGTYHRGQITTMLRQAGAAPPKSLDLIAFYRERGL